MCERYIIVSDQDKIEKAFRAKASAPIVQQFNISPGKLAPVITNDKPHEIQFFQFGLTPFWAKKRMQLFNARAEGDGNKNNDPEYTGGKGIISKPAFRKSIRSQRCLVIADAFIGGTITDSLDKPHLIYLENRKHFAFAGV